MSNKVYFKRYLHSSKESNFDLEEHFKDSDFYSRDLLYVGYEVELIYELDKDTGDFEIIACDGFYLSEKKASDIRLEEIPDDGI